MQNQTSLPPRAPGWPLLGSMPSLLREPFDFLEAARHQCGGVFRVNLGVGEFTVVGDPEAAEQVLVSRARNFDKGGDLWEEARELVGYGLVLSEGDLWRSQRRLMNPAFRQERIADYRRTTTETIDHLLDELGPLAEEGAPTDISLWTSKLSATLNLRLILGSELDDAKFTAFRDAVGSMLDGVVSGVIRRKLPSWMPKPGGARLKAARQTAREVARSLIDERRQGSVNGHDILSLMLTAGSKQEQMSDRQLVDEVVLAYIAGFDTTSSALSWGLLLLSQDPELVQEIQADLDREEDIQNVRLLDACMREVLRLYPPTPIIPRRTLVDEELGGHRIPAGTQLIVSPWVIQRDPEFWPEPMRFNPRRSFEDTSRPRLAWMPFGAGQRLCVGVNLAMLELTSTLGMLLRRYTPRPASDHRRSEPRLSFTLSSRNGVWLRLESRDQPLDRS